MTHPLEKMYVWMTGAKSEPLLAGPDAHWAALSCMQAPLMIQTEGLGEPTQEVTE